MSSSPAQAHGKLHYLADISLYKQEKPYELTLDLWYTPQQKSNNILFFEKDVVVSDMTGSLSDFSTDVHGFQALHYPTECSKEDIWNNPLAKAKYYEECEGLLRTYFGANEVLIFDSMLRKANAPVQAPELNKSYAMLNPALGLHIDQTPDSAQRRVAHCLPERAEDLLKGRLRILNIWRPLVAPVENHALLLCDYRTTKSSELVPADVVSPQYQGEQYWVRDSPDHQYWYYRDMTTDDVLIIKCFDSAAQTDEGIAKFAPHGAFTLFDANPDSQARESIEIRALVFSDE